MSVLQCSLAQFRAGLSSVGGEREGDIGFRKSPQIEFLLGM